MRILLTGAAGLIGGEVAARLLARGHAVTALVRRERQVRGNDGHPLAAREWDGGSERGRLSLLTVDITRERLGLSPLDWAAVAAGHELVIQCAALTRFDADEADHRAVNVDGTARLLTLAASGRMRFLHVSTAYVCGMRDGRVLEADSKHVRHANGYERSKAAAEELVRRSGVPSAIVRPSIVLGDSKQGAIRSFGPLYAAFKLIAEGRIRTLPAKPGASLDFVPIDHVAAGIVAVTERHVEAAGIYHLVSGSPVSLPAFADAIASVRGLSPPRFVGPEVFDPDALPAAERRLYLRAAAPFASYFQRSPLFDDSRFRQLANFACPPLGAAWLRRLIEHGIAVGFFRAAVLAE